MAPYELKNRNVLVTGGSRGLGSYICQKFADQGCNIAINYVSSEGAASELQAKLQSQHPGAKFVILQADVGKRAESEKLVEDAVAALGGLDIVINNAGWTKFSTFGDLDALTDDEWDKCWNVNVKSQLFLAKPAIKIFNANPDGGAFLITSSIAGITQSGSSMAYAVTKAGQLHLMKCLAKTQGPKTRINAVLPGLLLTEWGLQYPQPLIDHVVNAAVLKAETDLNDCAEVFVMLAANGSITGQSITVDSGLDLARSF